MLLFCIAACAPAFADTLDIVTYDKVQTFEGTTLVSDQVGSLGLIGFDAVSANVSSTGARAAKQRRVIGGWTVVVGSNNGVSPYDASACAFVFQTYVAESGMHTRLECTP